MIELNDDQVRAALDWHRLADWIERVVGREEAKCAQRAYYDLPRSGKLLLMPAWRDLDLIGLKTVMVCPDNHHFGHASHAANYILMDARTGRVIATMDAHELTSRRTAAVSAIATKRLMRPDASRLLVIGTGPVAASVLSAYQSLVPFDQVRVYGRDPAKAELLAAHARDIGIACEAVSDLETAADEADVISTATGAQEPVLLGDWLRPGTHVDLIGSFTPAMRETDDRLMARADQVWIDTPAAKEESGDLIDALRSGALSGGRMPGTLHDLIVQPPEREGGSITVFKSVGFAVPDFAAAQCVLEDVKSAGRPAPQPV